MKLVHVGLEEPLCTAVGCPLIWTIENPAFLYRVVTDLRRQSEGEEGDFVLLKEGKAIPLSAAVAVETDLSNLQPNDKKRLTRFCKKLEQHYVSGGDEGSLNALQGQIGAFVRELCEDFSIGVDWEEPGIADLLKAVGIRFRQEGGLLEQLCTIADVVASVQAQQLLITVHLRRMLGIDGTNAFYRHCRALQLELLDIEGSPPARLDGERHVIVTDDLCTIVDGDGQSGVLY